MSSAPPDASEAFALCADPGAYVPSPGRERALAQLRAGLEAGAVPCLEGPTGIGKTLLLQLLAQRVSDRFEPLYLPYPALSTRELCTLALGLHGRPSAADPELMLQRLAAELSLRGRPLLLLIDDAASLPPDTARGLAAQLAAAQGALRVALAGIGGEPLLAACAPFGDALLRVGLDEGIPDGSLRDYVVAQLEHAHAPESLRAAFDDNVLAELGRLAAGNPRRLHLAAQGVLRRAQGVAASVPDEVPELEAPPPEAVAAPVTVASLPAPLLRQPEPEPEQAPAPAAPARIEAPPLPAPPAPSFAEPQHPEPDPVLARLRSAAAAPPPVAPPRAAAPEPAPTREPAPEPKREPARETVAEPRPAPPPRKQGAPLGEYRFVRGRAVAAPPGSAAEPTPSAAAGTLPEAQIDLTLAPLLEARAAQVTRPAAPVPPPRRDAAPARRGTSLVLIGAVAAVSALVGFLAAARLEQGRAALDALLRRVPATAPAAPPEPATAQPGATAAATPPVPAPPTAAAEPPPAPAPPPVQELEVSINATPWAVIELDGRVLGETPLGGVKLVPGSYRFRARFPDGRISERVVEIDSAHRTLVFE